MKLRLWVLAVSTALVVSGVPREVPPDVLPADYGKVLPQGLWPNEPPAYDAAKVQLGRALYFDPLLSIDQQTSCASCHDPAKGFGDGRRVSVGSGGTTERHSPSLFNRGLGSSFAWDGRHATLSAQMLFPISSPIEMGLPLPVAVERLRASDKYAGQFERVYARPADAEALGDALAAFVVRITSGDSRVERFQGGDFAALSDLERTGLWIYESKGRCWRCHAGANFTDESLRVTGVGAREGVAREGRAAVTRTDSDRGRFKVPTLRGVAHHPPYMHDGSLESLDAVVAYYDRGGERVPGDERVPGNELEPLHLSAHERTALVAFLKALSP